MYNRENKEQSFFNCTTFDLSYDGAFWPDLLNSNNLFFGMGSEMGVVLYFSLLSTYEFYCFSYMSNSDDLIQMEKPLSLIVRTVQIDSSYSIGIRTIQIDQMDTIFFHSTHACQMVSCCV